MSAAEPQAKKQKVVKSEKGVTEEDPEDVNAEDSEEVEDIWKSNQNGDKYFELSGKKRCTLRVYNGTPLVDVREYYEKNGDMLPGKKGISLTKSQWKTLAENAAAITAKFNELG